MIARNTRKKVKEAVARVRSKDFIGEPEFSDPIVDGADYRLLKALNYYNVELRDPSKAMKMREWVVAYAQQAGFSSESLAVLKKMEDWRVTTTLAGMSRMLLNGVQMSPALIISHQNRITSVVSAWRAYNPPKPVEKAPEGPRHSERDSRMVAAVEEALDAFFNGGYKETFSTYDMLTKAQASKAQAEALATKYGELARELALLKAGDKTLKEGFASLSRTQINSYVEQVNSIIFDSLRYTTNRKLSAVRKPRKRKEKAAAELVTRVTYLKEFPELQLASVDPATIIGAESVWLYSTRYKILKRLVSVGGQTLTMSGSTVKNFDPALSSAKTLRKPAEVLKNLLGGTKHSTRKLLDDIKTKASEANGRINPETIIVRVFK